MSATTKKDNADVKAMLLRVRRECVEDYPYTEGDPVIDERYLIAMGMIAGIITETIQAVQQKRPSNLQAMTPP